MYNLKHNSYLKPSKIVHAVLSVAIVTAITTFSYFNLSLASSSQAAEDVTTVTYKIATNSDIANQDGNTVTTGAAEMWYGNAQNALRSYLGMRFTGDVIPPTAQITSAQIVFTSNKNQWILTSSEMYVEDNTAPKTFSRTDGPSNRTLVGASQSHSDNIQWRRNTTYAYDVTTPVKALYEKTGSINGAVSVIVQGRGNAWGRKTMYGRPNTNRSPQLIIKYAIPTAPTIAPTSTPTIIPTNTPTPTMNMPTAAPSVSPSTSPMPTMTGMPHHGSDSHSMGLWSPSKWDTCSKELHDSYHLVGPDGKKYPTWHPPVVTDPKTGQPCTFGHEHGRDPQGSNLMSLAKETYNGVLFGFANEKLDEYNLAKGINDGMRHEDHVGHKIEWENNVRMQVNKCTRPASNGCFETTPTTITCDFLMKVHQGTHSQDAFANNVHELAYFVQCNDGTKIAATKMVPFGAPGEFVDTCTKSRTIKTGAAVPSTSPTGDGVRFIGDSECVNRSILVPNGEFSQYTLGLYEDWVSSNYLRTASGQVLAYFDPHFAVFLPSRYFDPSKPNNVGRSIDTCYMKEANGDRARGGECEQITNYRDGSTIPVSERISYDDPRSPMNGVKREFYFNQTWINNTSGTTTWYTDPYGGNASQTPFEGAVRQYLSQINNYNMTIFESQAIGGDRYYGGNGVHAPN